MLKKLNFDSGRVFVVGDIHGEFSLLERKLQELFFNGFDDNLLSVGDLVDRGPESERALEFLDYPWFHAVRGNHEQMTIDAGGTYWHTANGGEWFNYLEPYQQRMVVRRFNELPLMIEATIPDGRRIGIAHASFPPKGNNRKEFITDWNDAQEWCDKTDWIMDENEILWNRYQIGRAKKLPLEVAPDHHYMNEFNVKNIDHVYFGHTPLKQPLTVGNMTWLDTGAFATGNLTIIEL